MLNLKNSIPEGLSRFANCAGQVIASTASGVQAHFQEEKSKQQQRQNAAAYSSEVIIAQSYYPLVIEMVYLILLNCPHLGLRVPGIATQLSQTAQNTHIAKDRTYLFDVTIEREHADDFYVLTWLQGVQEAFNDGAYSGEYPSFQIVGRKNLGYRRFKLTLMIM